MGESAEKRHKRQYNRRTDEQRIAELESKIAMIKDRVESKKRRDSPVLKEVPKLQRSLRKFAQLAQDHGREDIANSATAFVAGPRELPALEALTELAARHGRHIHEESKAPLPRPHAAQRIEA